jgi:hypothetical protein
MKTGHFDHVISSLKIGSFTWKEEKSGRLECVSSIVQKRNWRKQKDGSNVCFQVCGCSTEHSHASGKPRRPPLSSVRHKHFEGKLCH